MVFDYSADNGECMTYSNTLTVRVNKRSKWAYCPSVNRSPTNHRLPHLHSTQRILKNYPGRRSKQVTTKKIHVVATLFRRERKKNSTPATKERKGPPAIKEEKRHTIDKGRKTAHERETREKKKNIQTMLAITSELGSNRATAPSCNEGVKKNQTAETRTRKSVKATKTKWRAKKQQP